MPQIDANNLDHSPEIKEYFELVKRRLIERHHKDRHAADVLVDRYFSLDVELLERALVMHRTPEDVAEDLARGNMPADRIL